MNSGIDLDHASRDELVAHIHLQRRLIKALHEKVVELETVVSSTQHNNHYDSEPPSRAPTPPLPLASGSPLHTPGRHHHPNQQLSAGDASITSPEMNRLLGELRGIQTLLHSVDADDLPPEVRDRLTTTYNDISQIVNSSTRGPAGSAAVRDITEPYPRGVHQDVKLYRDERLRAGTAASPRQQRIEAWRARRRDSASSPLSFAATSHPQENQYVGGYRGSYDQHQEHFTTASWQQPTQGVPPPTAPSPRHVRGSTPTRRAPPLMGEHTGIGPQLLPPQALQDKIRARMEAIEAQQQQANRVWSAPLPTVQVVTAASQRRQRR